MKCPVCQTYTEVLETRQKENNSTYRRYQCANMHRFTTTETAIASKESHAKRATRNTRLSAVGVA